MSISGEVLILPKYSISYNHSDDKGIFRGNKYTQDNARVKLNLQKRIFNFDASLAFKVTQSQQPQYSLKEMYAMAPMVPVYDENQPSGYGLNDMTVDGVRLEMPNNRNVMADDHFKHKKTNGYDIIGNIGLTVDIAPWLKFKTAYAYRGYYEILNTIRRSILPTFRDKAYIHIIMIAILTGMSRHSIMY